MHQDVIDTDWQGIPVEVQTDNRLRTQSEIFAITREFKEISLHTSTFTTTFIYQESDTLVTKIKSSYSHFPIISAVLHSVFLLSLASLLLYIFLDIKTIHPFGLIWLLIASSGFSSVVWIAAKELDEIST